MSGPVVKTTIAADTTKAKPAIKRVKRGTKTAKKFDDDDGEESKTPAATPQMTNAYVPNIVKPVAASATQDQVEVPDFLKGVVDADP